MSIKEIYPLNLNVKMLMILNGKNKPESIGNKLKMIVLSVSLIGIFHIVTNILELKKDSVLLL
jgi:hypothetical protein